MFKPPTSFSCSFLVWAKTITLDYLCTHTPCPSASDLAPQLSHQTHESPDVPNFWRFSWVGSHLWSQRLFRLLYKIYRLYNRYTYHIISIQSYIVSSWVRSSRCYLIFSEVVDHVARSAASLAVAECSFSVSIADPSQPDMCLGAFPHRNLCYKQ